MADQKPTYLFRCGATAAAVVFWAATASQPACAAGDAEASGTTKPASSPAEQYRKLNGLIARFSSPDAAPAQRAELAERILQIRPAGAKRLLAAVNSRISRLVPQYKRSFAAQAVRTRIEMAIRPASGSARSPKEVKAEIEKARATVLGLIKMPSLTASAIRSRGEAAMATLADLMTVEPRAVLDRSAELTARRKELLDLARIRGRCLADDGGGGQEPADEKTSASEALARAEETAAMLAMPMHADSRRTLLANLEPEEKLKPEEARGIRELNRMRILLGLRALKIDLRLCAAARDHSHDMTERGFFGHTSPVRGKKTPWDRARRFGTTASAENIAYGVRTPKAANRIWFHSPGHFKNMFGPHRRVGLGYDGKWTQMFGR